MFSKFSPHPYTDYISKIMLPLVNNFLPSKIVLYPNFLIFKVFYPNPLSRCSYKKECRPEVNIYIAVFYSSSVCLSICLYWGDAIGVSNIGLSE